MASDAPRGTARGPRRDWGKWRAARDKKITKPRRLKTVKPATIDPPPAATSEPGGDPKP